MTPIEQYQNDLSRRAFIRKGVTSLGALAFSNFLTSDAAAASPTQESAFQRLSHYMPKVKRVIHLCMAGGPSHLETFDYKPELEKLHDKEIPASYSEGQQLAQIQGQKLIALGPTHPFKKYGKSGQEICTLFPHIGSVADDIAIIRSMYTEQINHDPAHTFMNTGSIIPGRPSMGAWTLYGLGKMSENLPGYVVLVSGGGQPVSSRQWHNGFLESKYQGVQFNSKGATVNYLNTPDGVSQGQQRSLIDAVNSLNTYKLEESHDQEIATRIAQYETAFRMQSSVPELTDFGQEPKHILEMYGANPGDGSFASNCLMARRLAERGVRFIQLYQRGWDHHGEVKKGMEGQAKQVDQPTAALIKDLKMRGMLDETLIVWGGEFGRTPMKQGTGRDHHINGFSIFLAGGGIKGGVTYGATDELGYHAVENKASVHDLHATILHLLGMDHTKLTYKFQGRNFRLTDVHGHLIKGVLA